MSLTHLPVACLLLFAPALMAQVTPSAPQPVEAEETAEARIDRDRYERMTVPVAIEGSERRWRFLVDTGAQATVVTHRVVEELGLRRRGTALLVAMGSAERVETVEVDRLEFADRTITGLIAPLLYSHNIGADGILGLDSLQGLRVLIDFRQDRMLVADAAALGGNGGYEIVVRARRKLGQMVITDARVNGVRTSVVIDTGAQATIGNRALLRKLRARSYQLLTTTDVHGVQTHSNLTLVDEMQIGGMTLNDMPVGFAESPVFDNLGLTGRPALVLGIANMRVFDRVAIDFATRQVLFDLPGRHDPAGSWSAVRRMDRRQ